MMMPPMSNGTSSSIAITANIPASGAWSQSYPGATVMEPIPEEEELLHSPLRNVKIRILIY
jgi:hypothetical protein